MHVHDSTPPPSHAATALLGAVGHLDDLVVAFSGGVDSTVVLAAALRALGPSRTLAAIADSPALARQELQLARRTAADLGAELVVLPTDELAVPGYRANGGDRCYFCKQTVLDTVSGLAAARGFHNVATGTHQDDRRAGHRPGLRAARERGVLEPLAETGLTKKDVRAVAHEWGLTVADKAGMPCLASRIAVGIPVTRERLALVERAEASVRDHLTTAGHGAAHDLRVRLLPVQFRVEVDRTTYEWLTGHPSVEAALLASVGKIVRLEKGCVAPYASGSVSTTVALGHLTDGRTAG
ncbi:ATP-dependent sacrificial sulfur transferase LarE [Streptomyces sp. NPDC000070]|uniref:ATP-dependent sacrificial sulfur transferase LarE n=1 Tax=Streptomyces sp. NPDC000070 TaxID=3154240 RepID=UPI00332F9A73